MGKSIRTTVSIPSDLYSDLAKAAESNHVSTAWIIREALRKYFGGQKHTVMRDGNGAKETSSDQRRAKNG